DVPDSLLSKLRGACDDVSVESGVLDEAGRDWWPITMTWALDGEIPGRPAAVARPREVEEVAAVLALCDEARVPVTTMASRSGVRTGGWPRGAVGPDLTQLFVGSEGTLGVITEATMRAHPLPAAERRAAFGFASFPDGLDACRRVLRRGGRPAVLRLYDTTEG